MDDNLLQEFLNESREHLTTIEADLLAIEEGGQEVDDNLINKVFRAAHSIKGGSGFLGLTQVKALSHKAETVLHLLRTRKLCPNIEVVNILLAAFDKLREMINNSDESENVDISDLVASLTTLAAAPLPTGEIAPSPTSPAFPAVDRPEQADDAELDFERARQAGQCIYAVEYDLIHDIEKQGLNLLQVFRELRESGEILDSGVAFEAVGTLDGPIGHQLPFRLVFATTLAPDIVPQLLMVDPGQVKVLFDPQTAPEPAPAVKPVPSRTPSLTSVQPLPDLSPEMPKALPVSKATPAPAETSATPAPSSRPAGEPAEETLRVHVGLLETLMNLAGELVLSRNQLHAAIAQQDAQALTNADQRLNQVTSELQDTIMRTRLQPIGSVFGKLPRVVRDLSQMLKKEVELDIRGKEVALDRSLIEGLSDPLTHMVRNAVDHGLETTEQRLKAGKSASGNVRIEARHEAGQVIVEIADDGKGIDPNRVAEAAVSRGLITAEKVRSLSTQEKIALILLPGLSTAEKVTDVSGRGVGMDVVKSNLERLGGSIEIRSELGKGSLFRIKLPLTLAIIPSLIVSVGTERFAIPQINVRELLHVRPEDLGKRLGMAGGVEVLLLRDQILPLVHLGQLLGVSSGLGLAESALGSTRTVNSLTSVEIAVVTTGAQQYGLVVTAFHETEEIVVKPLGRHLKALREYAGATILGDGKVALILDVAGVAGKADFRGGSESKRTQELGETAHRERLEDTQAFLVFHNGPEEVCATPLEAVLRIERVSAEAVETVGSRRTMQYRGTSLPLITLADGAQVRPISEMKDLAVIVSNIHGREVGLLGTMPVDVVEEKLVIDARTHRQTGVAGSAIIRGRTTLIANLVELVETVYPEWSGTAEPASTESSAGPVGKTVLLAEDSDFFRAQIKKFLEQEGYTVIEAADGEAAWTALDENADKICVLVTDIEMPRLTGLDLVRRVRGDSRFGALPAIALSSLASEEDIAKGKSVGVDQYLVKLDRDRLLETVHELTTRSLEPVV